MWDWLVATTPWYAWLILWPFVAMLLAPFVGRFLKRRRERMEREYRDRVAFDDNGETNRWYSSKTDEEWRMENGPGRH